MWVGVLIPTLTLCGRQHIWQVLHKCVGRVPSVDKTMHSSDLSIQKVVVESRLDQLGPGADQ